MRKLGLDMIDTNTFISLKLSYDFINRILDILSEKETVYQLFEDKFETIKTYHKCYDYILNMINFKNLHSNDLSYFNRGKFNEIDEITDTITTIKYKLTKITERLSFIIDSPNSCKLDHSDRFGYYLYCTKKRSTILTNRFNYLQDHILNIRDDDKNVIMEIPFDSFTYKKKDNTNVFVESPEINELTNELETLIQKLKK